ncbi:hypothetical protein MKZ38_006180 [Zalerion maritima]|uniref:Uncharacterized protein n=1 Tax=Zalerion maritima TaxID=339359 RepID=A0AAD5WNV4_9PEZI|nr:hypothetical protein MKZ38_006180 [Zalerion maritima]
MPLLERRVDRERDAPMAALYRIYEHIILDQHIEIRNELEMFWYHSTWAVRDIPDPKDPDPERYACLACVPKLLCLAFNKRIGLGLPRDAPPIWTADMMDEWKATGPTFEEEPAWVDEVPPLKETLAIPHWDNDKRDFVGLDGFDDTRASDECEDYERQSIGLYPYCWHQLRTVPAPTLWRSVFSMWACKYTRASAKSYGRCAASHNRFNFPQNGYDHGAAYTRSPPDAPIRS